MTSQYNRIPQRKEEKGISMRKMFGVLFSDETIIMCRRQCDLRRRIKTYLRISAQYGMPVRCVRFLKRYEEA